MKILVTGGSGYIGSHTVLELLEAGYETVVLDNLCNSSEESLKRVEKITGKKAVFYKADIRDQAAMDKIFAKEKPEAVIHFAGLKAVGESVQKPLMYYDNNIAAFRDVSVIAASVTAVLRDIGIITSGVTTIRGVISITASCITAAFRNV